MTNEMSASHIPTQLLPHQQRVVEERAQLHERIIKLEAFLTSPAKTVATPAHELELLAVQMQVMLTYRWVLGRRLAAWGVAV